MSKRNRRNRILTLAPIDPNKSYSRTMFVYGILRQPQTLEGVLRRVWDGVLIPATLNNHTCVRDCGPAYTFPMDGEQVDGYLVTGLCDEDLEPLDALEGTEHGHYIRKVCTVQTGDGLVETEFYCAGRFAVLRCLDYLTKGRTYSPFDEEDSPVTVLGPAYEAWKSFQDQGLVNPDEWEVDLTSTDEEDYIKWLAAREEADITDRPGIPAPNATPVHRYPNTPDHLPQRIGVPYMAHKRKPHVDEGGNLRLFVYDGMRSTDRLELTLDREWFGTKSRVILTDSKLSKTFPPFPETSAGTVIEGHLYTGISEADLKIMDRAMNVSSGYYKRSEMTFPDGSVAVYYSKGAKADTIIAAQAKRSKLAASARASAAARSADWNGARTAVKGGTESRQMTLYDSKGTASKWNYQKKTSWQPVATKD